MARLLVGGMTATFLLAACGTSPPPPSTAAATSDSGGIDAAPPPALPLDGSTPSPSPPIGDARAPDAAGPTPGAGAPPFGATQTGVATYYNGDGTGACSFDADPNALDFAAMDQPEWAGSAVCGACASVAGPSGNVTVRIVDLCPGCEVGHLDLSPQAFGKIAMLSAGRVPITWTLVPCAVTGSVAYRFKEGSSQYWTALQVRNHRLPIAKLEWKSGGSWVDVSRASYNYFVQSSGMGTGAVDVRITAWNGQTLEDTLPSIQSGVVVSGSGQF